ncbi:MAG: phosphoesterase [Terriglobia bacterium]|nr:phosphoesterase [Terriglobia bacterium]
MRRAIVFLFLSASLFAQTINLPSSKTLEPVPGSPLKLNSFPVNIVISPDGRYAAILNQGYGTAMSDHHESIAIYDIRNRTIRDFPDARLGPKSKQTYWLGLAFSSKGDELYASIASLTDPAGMRKGSTGNGIAVYSFANGEIKPARFLKIPLQQLAPGKRFAYGDTKIPDGKAISYPSGISVVPPDAEHPHDRLLVADNLSDNAILLDAVTGETLATFDLSNKDFVPAVFPHSTIVSPDGKKAWVSLWNTPSVAELDLESAKVSRILKVGPNSLETNTESSAHASAMTLSPDQKILFVALSNLGELDGVDLATGRAETIWTQVQRRPITAMGSYPTSVALAQNGQVLLIGCAGLNGIASVEIADFRKAHERNGAMNAKGKRMPRGIEPAAFFPTQWYPTAIAVHDDDVLIANGKGVGTGPNIGMSKDGRKKFPYIETLLNGTLQHTGLSTLEKYSKALTEQVERTNYISQKPVRIAWHSAVRAKLPTKLRARGPIKHVIYIIKENRTYDQIFGDLGVGDGDKSLTMYGWDITPNQHKLALQFGVLDNFYDSGEVSGNGHDWSTAAITSDYTERNIQVDYSRMQREYDYEGMVGNRYPIEEGIPDINEPGTGFLWGLVARNHRTYRHYGEFISTEWCNEQEWSGSPAITGRVKAKCEGPDEIKKGEMLPPNVGDPKGGPSPWPWPIPMIARDVPTKPELVGHFDPKYPDFRTEYPDQLRVDEFLNEFNAFVSARKSGKTAQEMPELIVLRLPNDHTLGTKVGYPTPSASVADNDLAVGRVVEAVSHSPYWDDTAILILEDDAQDGPDHVDAHRSTALVISKYSPSSTANPFIDHHFYTTVNMIRTLEDLLGLPPMNVNDAYAAPINLFSGAGNQPAFTADRKNLENGLLYATNPPNNPGAKQSADLNFAHADEANTAVLNQILWRDRKGNVPMPTPKHTVIRDGE